MSQKARQLLNNFLESFTTKVCHLADILTTLLRQFMHQ